MGTQNKNKELGEKHGLSFMFWKHQEGTMKWVGKGRSCRTSPSLSTHPSAKPNYTATAGIFHSWLNVHIKKQYTMQQRERPERSPYPAYFTSEEMEVQRGQNPTAYAWQVSQLLKQSSCQGPTLPPSTLTVTAVGGWPERWRESMSRPRNRIIRLTHTKQKWATNACQTPASCLSPTWARQRQVASPTSTRRKHRGKRGGDPHSLCWKERRSPSAGVCPHQRAQGVVNLSLSCGIWPVGQERKRERKAERELPQETKDAPLTYILCTRHPRDLGSCLLFWYPWFPHTPPKKRIWRVCWGEWSACLKGSLSTCQPAEELQNKVEGVFGLRGWGASTREVKGKGTCEGNRVELASGVPTESNHRQQEMQGVIKLRREKKGPDRGRPKGQMHSLPTSRLQPGLTRLC